MEVARKKRAQEQHFFLLRSEYKRSQWLLTILGFRNIPYVITISRRGISCECPDCTYRRIVCKHIYFVVLKIANDEALFDEMGNSLKINLLVRLVTFAS